MQLRGLELSVNLRITQADDSFDAKLKLDTTVANIDNNFYGLLFFDLLSGNVTGEDGVPTTGFKFKIYKTDNTEFCTSTVVGKLDWYETETTYISEAVTTIASQAVAVDTWIREVEIIYTGNEGGIAKDVVVMSSTALANVPMSSNDGQSPAVRGIKLETANGPAEIKSYVRFVINK